MFGILGTVKRNGGDVRPKSNSRVNPSMRRPVEGKAHFTFFIVLKVCVTEVTKFSLHITVSKSRPTHQIPCFHR
jgi:hypothetical protein